MTAKKDKVTTYADGSKFIEHPDGTITIIERRRPHKLTPEEGERMRAEYEKKMAREKR